MRYEDNILLVLHNVPVAKLPTVYKYWYNNLSSQIQIQRQYNISYTMLGATLARLGCYGVLVWPSIAFLISVFFVGEYLDRPPEG